MKNQLSTNETGGRITLRGSFPSNPSSMPSYNDETVNQACRPGLKDIWNAFMVEDAKFCEGDIPFCPTTASDLPHEIIPWDVAKQIHKRLISRGEHNYYVDAFVCWYLDDYKFDGRSGIWYNSTAAYNIIRHFAGAITPDFSTCQDFPDPLKRFNTYRMRAFGYWLGRQGISVINNARWGTAESYRYCFSGIPRNSIIAIGTCGGSPRKYVDRERFEQGLEKLVDVLSPHTILVYGSANYPCFERLISCGIKVVSFPSKTARAFERRKRHE